MKKATAILTTVLLALALLPTLNCSQRTARQAPEPASTVTAEGPGATSDESQVQVARTLSESRDSSSEVPPAAPGKEVKYPTDWSKSVEESTEQLAESLSGASKQLTFNPWGGSANVQHVQQLEPLDILSSQPEQERGLNSELQRMPIMGGQFRPMQRRATAKPLNTEWLYVAADEIWVIAKPQSPPDWDDRI